MKKNFFSKIFMVMTMLFGLVVTGGKVNEVHASGTYVKATSIAVGYTVLLVCETHNKELKGIKTGSSNPYGEVESYVSAPVGKYPLTVVEGYSEGEFAFKTGETYLCASGNKNYLGTSDTLNKDSSWDVTFEEGNAIITNSEGRNIRYRVNNTRFSNYSVEDGDLEVQLYKQVDGLEGLFHEYYNSGNYAKETVLNTKDMTIEEVKKYFHANADVKERTTIYYPNGLTMHTKEDEDKDGTPEDVISTYENKDGKVYHTGKGGDWSVNWTSVEDKFSTLYDFIENSNSGWTEIDGVYTYNLTETTATEEHKMTKIAREFVAPMWLEPNADNWNYVIFSKLTVEEVNNALVMKLYVSSDDSGKITDENGVFSTATIYKTNTIDEYSYVFTSKQFTGNGTVELGGLNWTLETDATDFSSFNNNDGKGQQIGKSGAAATSLILTTDSYIFADSFSICISGASYKQGTFTVSIGDTLIATETIQSHARDYMFEIPENAYGQLKVEYTVDPNTTAKAVYIKTLAFNVGGYKVTRPDGVTGSNYAIAGTDKVYSYSALAAGEVIKATNAEVTVDTTNKRFTLSNITGNVVITIE